MNSFTPNLRRVLCIGGGPAGLYFALLMKAREPSLEITVIERNRPFDTFGWGVVLSDQTLANLAAADAPTAKLIGNEFHHWDDIQVFFKGRGCSTSCRSAASSSASIWCSRPTPPTTRPWRRSTRPTW